MTPRDVSERVMTDRLALIEGLLRSIRTLPLQSFDLFNSDPRNVAAAESYLRRALEALLDVGRHILAKGFGVGVSEYKEIAIELERAGVLPSDAATTLRLLAGYRNRMVHYYAEIGPAELHEICSTRLGDLERVATAFRTWLGSREGGSPP